MYLEDVKEIPCCHSVTISCCKINPKEKVGHLFSKPDTKILWSFSNYFLSFSKSCFSSPGPSSQSFKTQSIYCSTKRSWACTVIFLWGGVKPFSINRSSFMTSCGQTHSRCHQLWSCSNTASTLRLCQAMTVEWLENILSPQPWEGASHQGLQTLPSLDHPKTKLHLQAIYNVHQSTPWIINSLFSTASLNSKHV